MSTGGCSRTAILLACTPLSSSISPSRDGFSSSHNESLVLTTVSDSGPSVSSVSLGFVLAASSGSDSDPVQSSPSVSVTSSDSSESDAVSRPGSDPLGSPSACLCGSGSRSRQKRRDVPRRFLNRSRVLRTGAVNSIGSLNLTFVLTAARVRWTSSSSCSLMGLSFNIFSSALPSKTSLSSLLDGRTSTWVIFNTSGPTLVVNSRSTTMYCLIGVSLPSANSARAKGGL